MLASGAFFCELGLDRRRRPARASVTRSLEGVDHLLIVPVDLDAAATPWRLLPCASIRNVDRWIPIDFLPYMFFSRQAPYFSATL